MRVTAATLYNPQTTMRLWLAKKIEVPPREQIVAQMVLGILSSELRAGQRLPSTRELARRLKVHPNTVSAAYRELERGDWVEFRRGSGVYIRVRPRTKPVPASLRLDRLIAELFRGAREQGVSQMELRKRLQRWLALQPPDHFLVVEPDEELRRIVVAELRRAVPFRIEGAGLDVCRQPEALAGAAVVVLPSKLERVRNLLPAGTECLPLQVRSVPTSLAEWTPIPPDSLIAVASRWPDFLKWARTMLLAAGTDTDALVFRDARASGWQDGLRATRAVVSDIVTAASLPRIRRVIVFRLVADASLKELQEFAKALTSPIA